MYTIEKISETEANIVTPVVEPFIKVKVTLDELNFEINRNNERLEAHRASIQASNAEIERLKIEKAELVAKKLALKEAGVKTLAEVQEAELQVVNNEQVVSDVQNII